jgi:hypothetical protein
VASRSSSVARYSASFQRTLESSRVWMRALLLAMTLAFLVPLGAEAQSFSGDANKPLVLIRFNQRSVYYDRQLYMAVSRAVEVKPGVMFEVVSFVPNSGDAKRDSEWKKTSAAHAKQVIDSLNQMGVPASRISYNVQNQQGLRFDEVHIFVR